MLEAELWVRTWFWFTKFGSKMLGAGGYKNPPQCPTISLLSEVTGDFNLALDPVPHKSSLVAQTGVFETS